MLEKEDIEAIRAIIREEIAAAIPPKSNAAIRQKRYREKIKERNERYALRNERYASPSENGVTGHNALRNAAFLARARDSDSSYEEYKEDKKERVLGETTNTDELENRKPNTEKTTLHRSETGSNGNNDGDLFLSEKQDQAAHLSDSRNDAQNRERGRSGDRRARRSGPLMSNHALRRLAEDPLYAGIDLVDQATKFERWCQANNKLNTVRRFVNWINRST